MLNLDIQDETELLKIAQEGNTEAQEVLLNRYWYIINAKAKLHYFPGADYEDILQEGLIGLYKAIRDYREGHDCSFRSFAILCISRQIITGVKAANCKKHQPLNLYHSIYSPNEYEDRSQHYENQVSEEEFLLRSDLSPEEIVISAEEAEIIEFVLEAHLSPFELQVFWFHVEGLSYEEMIVDLGETDTKRVDNALQRIRIKAKHRFRSLEHIEEMFQRLKEVEEMPGKGPRGYTFFLQNVCSGNDGQPSIPRDKATKMWNGLTPEEKQKWGNAAKGKGPIPTLKGKKGKRPKVVSDAGSQSQAKDAAEDFALEEAFAIVRISPDLVTRVKDLAVEELRAKIMDLEEERRRIEERQRIIKASIALLSK